MTGSASWKRLSLLGLLPLLFTSCSKSPLKYDKAAELGTIHEYEKLIVVKELATPTPSSMPETAAEAVASTPTPTAKATPSPTPKKKPEKTSAPSRREPELEDVEGFVGRRPLIDPFRVGEKVTLMLTYFGVSAGDMNMEVRPFVEVNGRKSYRFAVTLKSSPLFSMFYSVDDGADTFMDFENLTPYTFSVHATESKQLLEVRTFFDWVNMKGSRWERKVTEADGPREKKVEWDLQAWSQNIFSAVFYLRMFKLEPGKTIQFRVADEGKNYVIKGEVLRREKLLTDKGVYNTVVLKPTVEIEGVFQPIGTVLFWLTDDDRKFYVKIESEIKIGKIVGFLKDIQPGAL